MSQTNYTANDIVSLSAGKAFREKIGMYLTADRQEAVNLGLRELIVNVQDEYEVYKPADPFLKITLNSDLTSSIEFKLSFIESFVSLKDLTDSSARSQASFTDLL